MAPDIGLSRRAGWIILSITLAVGAASLLLLRISQGELTRSGQPAQPVPAGAAEVAATAEGFRAAAKRATPAVVSILTSRTVRVSRQYRERGLGSGVIVTDDGFVLTNQHLESEATGIRAVLPDKRESNAKLSGADAKTHLAVLKVDASRLPVLPLADSSSIEVGEIVLVVGNPFGVGQSVTMGIVSAMARSGVVDPEEYEDFIQTDAAINPGNSGGALIAARGELIAINTASISRSGGNQGIGFAIPSNVARHVMSHMVKDGRVIRGWLGVAAVAKGFGLSEPRGALTQVEP